MNENDNINEEVKEVKFQYGYIIIGIIWWFDEFKIWKIWWKIRNWTRRKWKRVSLKGRDTNIFEYF